MIKVTKYFAGGVDIHHGGDDHQPSQGRTNLVQLLYEYELDIHYDIDHSSPSQVPMFAHAGDSDDEDEDRENLVSVETPRKKSHLLSGGRGGGGERGREGEAGDEEEELSAGCGESWQEEEG